jgi:hypothetical protein
MTQLWRETGDDLRNGKHKTNNDTGETPQAAMQEQ